MRTSSNPGVTADPRVGSFDQIQLAIGQGLYVGTPLQLTNAYATFATGGMRWVPRLVTGATLPDGTVVEKIDPLVKPKVSVSKAQLDFVTRSLKAVVNLSYGTGFPAFSGFGIPVAGKSGTAENGTTAPHALLPGIRTGRRPADRGGHGARLRAAGHRRRPRRSARPAGHGALLLEPVTNLIEASRFFDTVSVRRVASLRRCFDPQSARGIQPGSDRQRP